MAQTAKLTDDRTEYTTNQKDRASVGTLRLVKPSPIVECPDCGGTGFFRYDMPVGHPKFGKLEKCTNTIHAEDRLSRMAKLSGLKPNELDIRLDDINRFHQGDISNLAMLDEARNVIDKPAGFLFLYGPPGNAKSVVLMAIVNEINEGGRGPAIYNKFVGLLEYVRGAFDPATKDSYIDRFNRLLSAPVLCIDEFDKVRETEFLEEFRFNFLDERYRQAAAGETLTVFASNSSPEKMPEAIYDRFQQFVIVHNTAPSARPAMGRRL